MNVAEKVTWFAPFTIGTMHSQRADDVQIGGCLQDLSVQRGMP